MTPLRGSLSAGTPIVGILGGTGDQGRGLGVRWARAGVEVILGSRDSGRGVRVAADLRQSEPGLSVRGGDNAAAASAGIVVVAVPYAGHRALLQEVAPRLAGKVVVDCVNPLHFDRTGAVPVAVPEGSAAEEAAAMLPDSRVVAAFHHLSATRLLRGSDPLDTDVLVVADDPDAAAEVAALADRLPGVRGLYCGPLRLAAQLEAMTAVLIGVNRMHGVSSGLRLTGVPRG